MLCGGNRPDGERSLQRSLLFLLHPGFDPNRNKSEGFLQTIVSLHYVFKQSPSFIEAIKDALISYGAPEESYIAYLEILNSITKEKAPIPIKGISDKWPDIRKFFESLLTYKNALSWSGGPDYAPGEGEDE